MGHEMYEMDQMFSVRERPWHYDETNSFVLADYPGREEAIAAAGHDFVPAVFPIFEKTPDGEFRAVDGYQTIRRSDQPQSPVFAVTKESYHPIPNDVGWDITEVLLEAGNNVKYETGGTLKNGAICYVTAYIDEPELVFGDDSPIFPYLATSWGHDGTTSFKTRVTHVRPVCWNTLGMAEAEGRRTGQEYTFRHTKNVMARIEDAKAAIRGAREDQKAFIELANELARIPISDKGLAKFVNDFIPEPAADIISNRVRNNIDEARGEVWAILNGGLTITTENRNSAYGVVQAGVEYLDHIRGFRSRDTYCRRTILRDEPLKAQLVPLARRIAEEEGVLV